jgi:hypothetical protein
VSRFSGPAPLIGSLLVVPVFVHEESISETERGALDRYCSFSRGSSAPAHAYGFPAPRARRLAVMFDHPCDFGKKRRFAEEDQRL